MLLLKQILVFLKLKYSETIGMYPIETILFLIYFMLGFLFLVIYDNQIYLNLHIVLSMLISVVCLLCTTLLREFTPLFIFWIKDNWKQAGEIVHRDNLSQNNKNS